VNYPLLAHITTSWAFLFRPQTARFCFFAVLLGFPPFYSHNEQGSCDSNDEIYKKVANGFTAETRAGYGAWFPEKICASDSAKDLISRLLVTEVAPRMTADEALSHPWLKGETASEAPIDITVLQKFSQDIAFKQVVTDLMVDTLSADQVRHIRLLFVRFLRFFIERCCSVCGSFGVWRSHAHRQRVRETAIRTPAHTGIIPCGTSTAVIVG